MGIYFIFLVFLIGLIMVVKGGDLFLDATIYIARITGVSFGIIGATLVSIATTLPEFCVSVSSSYEGFSDMAIGNALGSYICNIALVIGIIAIIKPIEVNSDFFPIKGAMMFSYLGIFYFFAVDGTVTKFEGKILMSLVLLFILVNLIDHKENKIKNKPRRHKVNKKSLILNTVKFVVGGILIILGADVLIDTGIEIANHFRISKQIISLTLLALGTSLPELVTAISATVKNKQGISVGNILGANILNITMVMGTSALISTDGLIVSSQTLNLDIPMATMISLIFIISGILFKKIGRVSGAILLIVYGVYMNILF